MRLNARTKTLLGVAAFTFFVATEIVAVAGATVWSLAAALHLGAVSTAILAVLVAVPAVYATAKFALLAFEAESRLASGAEEPHA